MRFLSWRNVLLSRRNVCESLFVQRLDAMHACSFHNTKVHIFRIQKNWQVWNACLHVLSNRQTDRQICVCNMHAIYAWCKRPHKFTSSDMITNRHTDRQQTNRQTNRHTDRQTAICTQYMINIDPSWCHAAWQNKKQKRACVSTSHNACVCNVWLHMCFLNMYTCTVSSAHTLTWTLLESNGLEALYP